MPTNTLNERAIRAAKPGDKLIKLFDGHGLYLAILPSGTKTWRMAYRMGHKAQTATLGTYPLVSLAEAREKRDSYRKQLLDGVKPGAKAKRATPTLMEAADRYFTGRADLSASYLANARRGITTHLACIGDMPVADITRQALLDELMKLNDQGKFVYVRKIRMWVGQVMDWAVAQGMMEVNPAKLIDPEKAFGRAEVVSFAALEPKEVPALMERLGMEADTQSAMACRFIALTWLRTNEARLLEFDDIDKDGMLLIPRGRMKRGRDHLVPLPRQALEIVEEMRRRSRGSKYVFPSANRIDRPMSENAVLYLLYRLGYKGKMTGHGWRSVGSTWANERGMNPDAIEMQLAHSPENKTRAVYNRAKYLEERRAILQQCADWLMPG